MQNTENLNSMLRKQRTVSSTRSLIRISSAVIYQKITVTATTAAVVVKESCVMGLISRIIHSAISANGQI